MKLAILFLSTLFIPVFATAADNVDAVQLANEFYNQKDTVVAKYDGKPFVLSGTVQKQDQNGNGDLLLLVGSDPTDTYVSLRFVKIDEAKASALKVGSHISVTCVGDFKALPSAKDCHF